MGKDKDKKHHSTGVYDENGNNEVMNIPSISSLHNEKNIKKSSTNDIYKTVLNKCIEKIIYTNRHTDKTFIIFEVPKILIGQTTYDMKSCIHYVINSISSHGYLVQFIEPFYIYIDWGSKQETVKREKEKALESKTKELLKHFHGVNKVEYIYEDVYLKQKDLEDKDNHKDRRDKRKDDRKRKK